MTDKPNPTKIERSKPLKVTGRLKLAVDAMIWKGLTRREAAEFAKMKEHALYCAFRKPHVRAYYLAELGALRTSARARNFHLLESIAEKGQNEAARVKAIQVMAALEDDAQQRGQVAGNITIPGLTIVINPPLAAPSIEPRGPMVDITPRPPARVPGFESEPRGPVYESTYQAPALPAPAYQPAPEAEEYIDKDRSWPQPTPYSPPPGMVAGTPKLPGEPGYRAPGQPRPSRRDRRRT
jgi:hypothetical protein